MSCFRKSLPAVVRLNFIWGTSSPELESIEKAISIKPDYWLPYAMASDFYKVKGDLERARKWLRRGLQASPRAQPLESRLAGLGEVSNPRK